MLCRLRPATASAAGACAASSSSISISASLAVSPSTALLTAARSRAIQLKPSVSFSTSAPRSSAPNTPSPPPSTSTTTASSLSPHPLHPGSSAPLRVPGRLAILSTYRLLRRTIHQTFYASSHYAEYDEKLWDQLGQAIAGRSAGAAYRKEEFAKAENAEHVKFAATRSPQWLELIRQAYQAHKDETDPATIARLHRQADELAQLMISNMEHSRYLLEGGWGIRRNTQKQLQSVAHRVGLRMPESQATASLPAYTPAGEKHKKARDAKLLRDQKFSR